MHRAFDRTTIPDLPGGVVDRPRLFRMLNESLRHPVVTVTGPAGWGKTQLLASWVRSPYCAMPAAWLSVDPSDTDPQVFWPAVMAAVSRIRGPVPEGDRTFDSVAPVAEALLGVEDSLVLILDDVHLLQGSPVGTGLAGLVRMLPPQVRVVLSGQYLPELPLAKLRVERRVGMITGRDLAFTVDETAEMLAESGNLVPAPVAAELHDRTEGWSAGLRLAVLSLLDGLAPEDLLSQFGGDHVEVADYLMSEVLSRLPENVEDFLLRTSICDRINGDLARELTGRADSAELLRSMALRNVFTTSDGPRQTWFRYHTMLSELLRSRLPSLGPEAVEDLHLRASAWFEAHDMPRQAFDHAARARRWDRARDLLMSQWLPMYLDGKLVSIAELVDRLPSEVAADPGVRQVRAAVGLALGDGHLSPGEEALSGAGFAAYTSDDDPAHLVVADRADLTIPELVVDLERARLAGDLSAVVRAAQRLVAHADASAHRDAATASDLRALAFQHLGITEYWAGRRDDAEAHLREALAEATGSGREYVQLGCLSHLVLVLTVQNRLTEGMRATDAALALVSARGWEITGAAAEVWHALGWVAYLRGDLDLAEKHLTGATLAVRRQDAAVVATVLLVRGLTASLRGRKREALTLLDEARTAMSRVREHYVFDDYVVGEQARLRLAVGDAAGARRVLDRHPAVPDGPVHLSVASAELLVHDGDLPGAVALLERATKAGQGLIDQHLQALVLLALLHDRSGDEWKAVATLCAAIALAAPEGYVQPFVQFGRPIERLLHAAAPHATAHRAFVSRLLDQHEGLWSAADAPRPPGAGDSLAEPLTERELEVLRALNSDASLAELSDALYISVNTLKAHLRNLYRKLDVGGRHQAVAKAKALGLV
ncbi:LuxR C-terminal-related transcriptional regulator [Pimelobacter simplex]|uniref:LuxR C-terminal-related transcriptional regulator n=1 Tax=Nocardioides simplex TaxID=2045 RepID=UPI003AAAE921